MGEVFLADDTQLERRVAIKVLPDRLQGDPVARARFEREAKAAAALDHPYICKIYELATVDGRVAIVMEHVTGETLEQTLAEGPLAPAQVIQIAAEMAEALSEAHAHRILHRDLKPANLMLTGQGHVKVMDFGLAKRIRDAEDGDSAGLTPGSLTETGAVLGTPAYMAPEQIRGEPADARSDIFSFGVVLFELLTGEHPFRRGTVSDTIAAILRDAPTRADGSDARIDHAIFDKLLAKTPADRYQSFEEVSVAVRRLRDARSGWTVPLSKLADASAPPLGGRRTPFVGRDAERAELGRWLDLAVRGRGGLVLIGGEPGVGKTRLVEQLLDVARQRRCLALTGHCYEMEGTAPFIPFVEIIEQYARVAPLEILRETLGDAAPEVARLVPDLRRLIPDIPPPLELPPAQQRHYLFKNVGEFLERVSRANSTVLLLDDLQWADTATLLLLQHVAPLVGQLPVLVLGTYRDVELDVNRPFAATLETLNRKRLAQRLNLQRLPQAEVAGMLAALGGDSPPGALVAGIYRETEGNPFFVEEVYQHLQEEGALHRDDGTWRSDLNVEELDVPEGVRLVIGRRLERVSADSRKVLTFGAVVGRGFGLELLEAVGDVTGDALLTALEEAESNHLIMPMSGRAPRWEFSHALIRQTLAAGLSLPRRQRLHLKVAEAIERAAGSNPKRHASDLAHHLFQAGTAADPDQTVHFLTVAGDQALESGGFEEALGSFNRALSLEPSQDAVRAALLFQRGMARRGLDQMNGAIADWNNALPLYEALSDHPAVATTCRELAHWYAWTSRHAESLASARRGLAVLGREPSADRCRLLPYEGWALSSLVELAAASDALAEALEMAEALGDERLEGEVRLTGHYVHHHNLHSAEGYLSAERAVECLRAAGDPGRLAEALLYLHYMSVRTGRVSDLVPLEQEIESLFKRQGRLDLELMALFMRDRDWLLSANLDRYEAFAREWCTLSARMGAWVFVGNAWMAQARVWKGEWMDARRHAKAAVDAEPIGEMETGHGWSTLFLCDALLGRRPQALELLAARRDELPRPGKLNGIGAWSALFKVVEGLAVLGEAEGAAELYPRTVAAIATGTLVPRLASHLTESLAGIAAAAGREWTNAREHFETALRQAYEIPFRSEQAEVRRWYAQMLLDRNAPGDREKARTMLGEVVEMYGAIGMPRHLEIAREMLKG